jgi:arginyl-tRNA synthetase
MIKNQITKELNAVLEKMNIKDIDISLDIPSKPEHGDYATSIPLKLTKILKKNPFFKK